MVTVMPTGVVADASRPTGVLPYGIFSVGPVLPLTRVGVVEWENRVCVDIHETVSECFGGDPEAKDLTGKEHWQTANPFALLAATDCPPDALNDGEARIRDKIVAGEQFGVERHFYENVLTDGPVSVGAALTGQAAVARLEQSLGAAYGVPGVIHMSRELFTNLELRVQRVSGRLETQLGTLLVIGSGYPNDDAMYGTGPLRVFRSGFEVSNAVDWEHNRDVDLAERSYVVAADLCEAVFVVTGIV